jgi:hypothetical protein
MAREVGSQGDPGSLCNTDSANLNSGWMLDDRPIFSNAQILRADTGTSQDNGTDLDLVIFFGGGWGGVVVNILVRYLKISNPTTFSVVGSSTGGKSTRQVLLLFSFLILRFRSFLTTDCNRCTHDNIFCYFPLILRLDTGHKIHFLLRKQFCGAKNLAFLVPSVADPGSDAFYPKYLGSGSGIIFFGSRIPDSKHDWNIILSSEIYKFYSLFPWEKMKKTKN